MDADIYGGSNLSSYHTSIPANDVDDYDVSLKSLKFFLIFWLFDSFFRMMTQEILMVH